MADIKTIAIAAGDAEAKVFKKLKFDLAKFAELHGGKTPDSWHGTGPEPDNSPLIHKHGDVVEAEFVGGVPLFDAYKEALESGAASIIDDIREAAASATAK